MTTISYRARKSYNRKFYELEMDIILNHAENQAENIVALMTL